MLGTTLPEVIVEINKELDRLHVQNVLSREIVNILVKTAYQIGRNEGMQEMFTWTKSVIAGPEPEPTPITPKPEPEPTPEPTPPEPQGRKIICTNCGTEQDSHQREYDLDDLRG